MSMPTLSLVSSASRHTPSYLLDLSLREQIARLPVRGKHAAVSQALTRAVDPQLTFHFGREYDEESHRTGRILAPDGSEVAPSAFQWLQNEITRAGDHWRNRYRELAASSFIRTEYRIRRLYFFARGSNDASDFLQALVYIETEFPAKEFVPGEWSVREPRDVWDYATPDESAPLITRPTYRLRQVEHVEGVISRDIAAHRATYDDRLAEASAFNIRVFDFDSRTQSDVNLRTLHKMPDLPPPTRLQRWFADWTRSSAGRSGARPEEHWFFSIYETVWKDKPVCEVIPGWVTRRRLPEYNDKRVRNASQLIEWLETFDAKAGHPFAWYFFMLHGNRIHRDVGDRILEAVRGNATWLPECDRQVFLDWAERRYGF